MNLSERWWPCPFKVSVREKEKKVGRSTNEDLTLEDVADEGTALLLGAEGHTGAGDLALPLGAASPSGLEAEVSTVQLLRSFVSPLGCVRLLEPNASFGVVDTVPRPR